jgi:methyltransferase family protein
MGNATETFQIPQLPFPDESFDVVPCRMALMFFPAREGIQGLIDDRFSERGE